MIEDDLKEEFTPMKLLQTYLELCSLQQAVSYKLGGQAGNLRLGRFMMPANLFP